MNDCTETIQALRAIDLGSNGHLSEEEAYAIYAAVRRREIDGLLTEDEYEERHRSDLIVINGLKDAIKGLQEDLDNAPVSLPKATAVSLGRMQRKLAQANATAERRRNLLTQLAVFAETKLMEANLKTFITSPEELASAPDFAAINMVHRLVRALEERIEGHIEFRRRLQQFSEAAKK